ncbi:hypothetical protein JCM9534A_34500 [Catenuloplanes indicus JCM 9534]|uniref:Transposase n=1 Tax=Catenuloplanes indicus TaxID=137267 RepID=A0AAE3W049_9ACTN|nr:hypothetical protein [Catenuloplanes indicus]
MRCIRLLAYAILDGTLIPIDRVADQKPYYSGKHKRHGANVMTFADKGYQGAGGTVRTPFKRRHMRS